MRTMLAGWLSAGICLAVIGTVGCGGPYGPPRKETFSVKGRFTVDGQPPGESLQVECHNKAGIDEKMPYVSQALTEPDGSFEISTYDKGDGMPAGDYVLTVTWKQFNAMSMSFGGEDKLKGRYEDPEKSEITVSVKDKSVDLGEIPLTTK